MSSSLFAQDGSVIPNIRTMRYAVTLAPDRIHTKVQGARIEFDAEPGTQRSYAEWLCGQLPMMRVVSVETLPKPQPAPEGTQPADVDELLSVYTVTPPGARMCCLNRETLEPGTLAWSDGTGLVICAACAAHATSCTDDDCDHPRYRYPAPAAHTCGGPAFGRKTPGCPRCDQLLAGAPAIVQDRGTRRADDDARQRLELAQHFASEKHRSGGCGPVCTKGDW
jgi:hypothetical protein